MYVGKHFRSWSNIRIYAACLAGCGVVLALGGVAFSISTDLVATASAQVEPSRHVDMTVVAALPALEDNVNGLFPSSKRPAAGLPPSVVPVLISRLQTSPAAAVSTEVEETASPDADEWASHEAWTPDRTDTFRTVCVRLCDGAYFPISFATTRDRFKADAAKCKSTCGAPAKLFVGPPDGSADDLVDLRGGAYSDLPTAFKYRTSYDAACTCKAQPWETVEVERHRQLAETARLAVRADINSQVGAMTKERPVSVLRSEGQVEVAAIQPGQTPQLGKLDSGRNQSGQVAVVAVTAEPTVRRSAARSPAGRAAKSSVTVKKRVVNDVRVAATSLQPRAGGRPAIGRLDSGSMQRPFRAKEYWRLSYWEAPAY